MKYIMYSQILSCAVLMLVSPKVALHIILFIRMFWVIILFMYLHIESEE